MATRPVVRRWFRHQCFDCGRHACEGLCMQCANRKRRAGMRNAGLIRLDDEQWNAYINSLEAFYGTEGA